MGTFSSASPSSWRPTTRTLGALFAGSALALSATVLHGGSLLFAGDETEFIAEPAANPAIAQPQQLPPTSSTAPFSESGQAAPWTPGATPQWSSPLTDLPLRPAPVLEAPQHRDPRGPVTARPAAPSGSEVSAASPAAPTSDVPATSGTTEAAPQAADPQRDGRVNGLLGGVLHATKGISR
jgi:hypothetical protein